MPQRPRFTKQFQEEAVRLSTQEGVSLFQVDQDLGLDATMLCRWRKEANQEGAKAFQATAWHVPKNWFVWNEKWAE